MRLPLALVSGLACASLAVPTMSLAQADGSGTTQVLPTSEAVQGALNALDAPNGSNSPATTYQPKVSVETATDKSTASLDVGGVLLSPGGADYLTAAFTAKAPFDSSKSDVQDLGSLSGLTAGTQAHLALAWSRWPLMTRQAVTSIVEFQNSSYLTQLYGLPWDQPTVPGAPTLRDALVALKLDPTPLTLLAGEETYQKIIVELNKEIDAFNTKNAATVGFKPLAHVSILADYSKVAEKAKQAYYVGIAEAYAPKCVPSLALTLDGNQQSFTYVETSSPTKTTSENKIGVGASFVASLLRDNWLASISYAYAHSYMAQPSGQVCTPIAGSTSTQCVTAAVGAPKVKTDRLVTAEYRIRFTPLLAISPQVQYSTVTSKWGVQLPIYMMADKTKALNAGVKLGWTTAAHFGASLFVGKPFSFH